MVPVRINENNFFIYAAYSLNPDGTAEELALQSTEKTYTFQTDGSPYYILAENQRQHHTDQSKDTQDACQE